MPNSETTAPKKRRSSRPSKAVTLRAVAAEAGCSTATVSKALNGLPVSPENLKRVFEAAEKLEYVPNLAARSMRNERSMTVGMVVSFEGHPRSELLSTVQDLIAQMEDAGYTVLLSIARGERVDLDQLLQRFLAHRVDGLFFWNARRAATLAWYERSGIPIVAVSFRAAGLTHIPLVTPDAAGAFADAGQDLVRQGHRHVAEIVVDRTKPIFSMYPADPDLQWQELRMSHADELREVLARSLDGPNPPTAIFAAPPISSQVLTVADELGLRIPEDLSLVSYYDPEDVNLFRVPLSSIRTDYDKIGTAAASAMLDALTGLPIEDAILPNSARYLPRASTGPAPVR